MGRVIFHIDVNSAFLSWTAADMVERGSRFDPRLVPSVVSGKESTRHGIVLAKSVPASRLGIKTGEPLFMARERCPELVVLPMRDGIYARKSLDFYNMLLNFSPIVEQFSVDECFMDCSNMDRFFGSPLECARLISRRIREELGFTVNIGISTNKILAKMASDFEKPDKIHELYPNMIKDKMWHLPVRALFSVGRQTTSYLNSVGIYTIGDLAHANVSVLRPVLKSQADRLVAAANGIDPSPVKSEAEPPKSMSMSYTTPNDVNTMEDAKNYIITLCEKLSGRLRDKHFTTGGVSVNLLSKDRVEKSHQVSLFGQTQCSNTLINTSCQLLEQVWDMKAVRRIGVSFWNLKPDKFIQGNIWTGSAEGKWSSFDEASDKIRRKFGDGLLKPCSTMDNSAHNHTKIVAFAPEFSLSGVKSH